MAAPSHVFGYGSSTLQRVFSIGFNHPLSSKVKYECYDNDQTFPAVDSVLTADNDVFNIASNPTHSMIALHDNTATHVGATAWFPTDSRPNTGSFNLMHGTDLFVTQQGATLDSFGGGSIYFNMQVNVPASAQTDSSMGFDLLVRYTFTSTTPTLQWMWNDLEAGGTGIPVWSIATPGTVGLVHCRSATSTSGPYLANIPSTGQEKTVECIVATVLE